MIVKKRYNFTLSPEAYVRLKELAHVRGLLMSSVLETLIRGAEVGPHEYVEN